MSVAADKHGPPPRRSSALLGLRITFSGLLCVGVVLLVGLAALNNEANLLFLLFGISAGVLVFSALAPVFMVRKVEVERVAPMAVVAGQPFTLSYMVRNRRRWLRAWSLLVGEVPPARQPARFSLGFIPAIDPGDQRRLELAALCPARGRVLLERVRVLSRFPFGLFACSVDLDLPGELIVYPAVGRLRRDLWRERRAADSPDSHSLRRHSPENEEFYGVREYRPGDNLRWIHWRRSARMGELIVRESTPARTQQLTIVLDPWPALEERSNGNSAGNDGQAGASPAVGWLGRLTAAWRSRQSRAVKAWPQASVERLISLAATAVCDALEAGYRVGLIVRAGVPVVIAPSGGRSHRQRLLHELALLRPGATGGLDELVSRIRWSSGWHSRCLVCATRRGAIHEHVARLLAGRAESVRLLTTDSEGFEQVFEPSLKSFADRPQAALQKPPAAGRVR